MAIPEKPNPFLLLLLPTNARPEEIMQRASHLKQKASKPAQKQLVDDAVAELQNERTRLVQELFEVPETTYNDDDWMAFSKSIANEPLDTSILSEDLPVPQLHDLDLGNLVRHLLEEIAPDEAAGLDPLLEATLYAPRYVLPMNEWDNL